LNVGDGYVGAPTVSDVDADRQGAPTEKSQLSLASDKRIMSWSAGPVSVGV